MNWFWHRRETERIPVKITLSDKDNQVVKVVHFKVRTHPRHRRE